METNANQKVTCIANYVYDASEPDELSLRPGDVLRDVERLPGGWWRGELRGRRGMFPDNFVALLADNARSAGVQGRCRAVFSYQPANPDELALSVGDVIDVLAEVEEGWWQGRRQGRVGVFPSNFVVMLDQTPPQPVAAFEPAPALPPKPVKELCRVLFPYSAANEDELTLSEGDVVTIVSKDAPDRGWWRGELHGRVGLFPDNFVQLLPAVMHDVEEKKPERPPSKTSNSIYPILNKYSEKTASVKELTTSKISMHKENTVSKESSTQSTVTHTSKSESDKLIHNESTNDGSLDGQVKKPPVPMKKSPTPTPGVGGLFSGLKNKMLSADKDKEKSPPTAATVSSGSSSGGEWDRTDGSAGSRPAQSTFDHVERNSILNDPRAGRVKAPRRRPPSQVFRDDALSTQPVGLSNGHEATNDLPAAEKPPEKAEEIRPRTREWEKQRAPWMAELKLNQAKKTSFGSDGKSRSVSASSESGGGVASKAGGGSTDRILDCGLEEKRSTHSMEMSKSTSSISSRLSLLESFDEPVKLRHPADAKRDAAPPLPTSEAPTVKPTVQSPTAAGRTFTTMLEEIKKQAPTPPAASARTHNESADKSPNKFEKIVTTSEKLNEVTKFSSGIFDRSSMVEKMEKTEEKFPEKHSNVTTQDKGSTLERRLHSGKSEKSDNSEALIAQLNNRITNLEKLLEVQNAKFNAAIDELRSKLMLETEKRLQLQAQLDKFAHCVTQV